MMKATECLGEIMSDGHINIPENEKQLLNWRVGRKIRVILFSEEATDDYMLKRLQDKGLLKAPRKERIKPLNQRRFIRIKGEQMAETVIRLRGEK
jgi:hypothetical protein